MADPIACPTNLRWLERMLAVLPPGLRGKLEPYEVCLKQQRVLRPRIVR